MTDTEAPTIPGYDLMSAALNQSAVPLVPMARQEQEGDE